MESELVGPAEQQWQQLATSHSQVDSVEEVLVQIKAHPGASEALLRWEAA